MNPFENFRYALRKKLVNSAQQKIWSVLYFTENQGHQPDKVLYTNTLKEDLPATFHYSDEAVKEASTVHHILHDDLALQAMRYTQKPEKSCTDFLTHF